MIEADATVLIVAGGTGLLVFVLLLYLMFGGQR